MTGDCGAVYLLDRNKSKPKLAWRRHARLGMKVVQVGERFGRDGFVNSSGQIGRARDGLTGSLEERAESAGHWRDEIRRRLRDGLEMADDRAGEAF